jgi:5'(3')-deoxyribonucleotidase
MKPTIFCDLDGMVANLLKKFLTYYNEENGTEYTNEQVNNTHPHIHDALDKYLVHDNMFTDLEPIEGFAEALPRLHELGDVHIASTPSRNPDSASDKLRWVLRHFPSIEREQIILIKHKWLLSGPVGTIWFEDWWKNIKQIRKAHPDCFIGALAYPYNERAKDDVDWYQPHEEKAWHYLVRAAERYAGQK